MPWVPQDTTRGDTVKLPGGGSRGGVVTWVTVTKMTTMMNVSNAFPPGVLASKNTCSFFRKDVRLVSPNKLPDSSIDAKVAV